MEKTLLLLLLGAAVCKAAYQLDLNYNSANFIANFFWSSLGNPLPGGDNECDNQKNYWARDTNGWERNLTVPYNPNGPQIVRAAFDPIMNRPIAPRMVSFATRGKGLWITKIYHLPTADYAWPAFWFLSGLPCDKARPNDVPPYAGNNWPFAAEIDWIESFHHELNSPMYNKPVLHTGYKCVIPKVDWNNGNAYTLDPLECNYYWQGINGPKNGQGCVVVNHVNSNYPDINNPANGGGAYFALLWDSAGIKQYFWRFDNPNIPSDINGNSPNPYSASWNAGLQANFPFGPDCSESQNFGTLKNLVIDIKICGNPLNDRAHGCTPPTTSAAYNDQYISFDYVRYFKPI